jgi:hypothetical protein
VLKTVISAGCLLVFLFSPVAFAADAKKAGSAMPTLQEFQVFYRQYQEACRKGDAEFLKKLLPPDIPKDQFAFVLKASRQVMLDLDASGVKPKFVQTKNRYDANYEGKLGDGMTKMALDFYFHEGRWLKYDPKASK